MGKVTDHVLALVHKQIGDKGIVVWYDPDRTYARLVADLQIAGAALLQLAGGYFELREQLEPFLEFVDADGGARPEALAPPKLVSTLPGSDRFIGYRLLACGNGLRVAAFLIVVCLQPFASPLARHDSRDLQARPAPKPNSGIGPAEWAQAALAKCLTEDEDWQAHVDRLEKELFWFI